MDYLNRLLRKSGGKKSEPIGQDLASEKREFAAEENKLSTSLQSTPKKHQDCDTESDTTAEYESAGEASPWEKPSNLTALAEYLAGVHLSTPDNKVHSEPTISFPFSPISAEDESDDEVTAIISSGSQSSSHTLSFHERENLSLRKEGDTVACEANTSFSDIDEFKNSKPCKRHSEVNIDSALNEAFDSLNTEVSSNKSISHCESEVCTDVREQCNLPAPLNKNVESNSSVTTMADKLLSNSTTEMTFKQITFEKIPSTIENISNLDEYNALSCVGLEKNVSSQVETKNVIASESESASDILERSSTDNYLTATKHRIDTIFTTKNITNVISETKQQIDSMFKHISPNKEAVSTSPSLDMHDIKDTLKKPESDSSSKMDVVTQGKSSPLLITKKKIDSIFTSISPKKNMVCSNLSDNSSKIISLDSLETKSVLDNTSASVANVTEKSVSAEKLDHVHSESHSVSSRTVSSNRIVVDSTKQQIDKIFKSFSPQKTFDTSISLGVSDLNTSKNLKHKVEACSTVGISATEQKLDLSVDEKVNTEATKSLFSPCKNNSIEQVLASVQEEVINRAAEKFENNEEISHNSSQIPPSIEQGLMSVQQGAEKLELSYSFAEDISGMENKNKTKLNSESGVESRETSTFFIGASTPEGGEPCINSKNIADCNLNNKALGMPIAEKNEANNSAIEILQKSFLENEIKNSETEKCKDNEKINHNSSQTSSSMEQGLASLQEGAEKLELAYSFLEDICGMEKKDKTKLNSESSVESSETSTFSIGASTSENGEPSIISKNLLECNLNDKTLDTPIAENNEANNFVDIIIQKSFLENDIKSSSTEKCEDNEKINHNSSQTSSCMEQALASLQEEAEKLELSYSFVEDISGTEKKDKTKLNSESGVESSETSTFFIGASTPEGGEPCINSKNIADCNLNNKALGMPIAENNEANNSAIKILQKSFLENEIKSSATERCEDNEKINHNSSRTSSSMEQALASLQEGAEKLELSYSFVEDISGMEKKDKTKLNSESSVESNQTSTFSIGASTPENGEPSIISKNLLECNLNDKTLDTRIAENIEANNSADIILQKSFLENEIKNNVTYTGKHDDNENMSINSLQTSPLNIQKNLGLNKSIDLIGGKEIYLKQEGGKGNILQDIPEPDVSRDSETTIKKEICLGNQKSSAEMPQKISLDLLKQLDGSVKGQQVENVSSVSDNSLNKKKSKMTLDDNCNDTKVESAPEDMKQNEVSQSTEGSCSTFAESRESYDPTDHGLPGERPSIVTEGCCFVTDRKVDEVEDKSQNIILSSSKVQESQVIDDKLTHMIGKHDYGEYTSLNGVDLSNRPSIENTNDTNNFHRNRKLKSPSTEKEVHCPDLFNDIFQEGKHHMARMMGESSLFSDENIFFKRSSTGQTELQSSTVDDSDISEIAELKSAKAANFVKHADNIPFDLPIESTLGLTSVTCETKDFKNLENTNEILTNQMKVTPTCKKSSESISQLPPMKHISILSPFNSSMSADNYELSMNSPTNLMKLNISSGSNVSDPVPITPSYVSEITGLSSAEIEAKSNNSNTLKISGTVQTDASKLNIVPSLSSQSTLHVHGEMTTRNENFSFNLNKTTKDIQDSSPVRNSEEIKYCGFSDSFQKFKLDDLSESTVERKSYEDLLDRCLEQERQLGFESIKEEADKLIKELANASSSDSSDISLQFDLPAEKENNSEAGPVTADEDFNRGLNQDFFQDATLFDFDFLSKIGKGNPGRRLVRESLFLKFDPLASAAAVTPEPATMAQPDSSCSGDAIATPPRAPLPNGDDKLVSISPNEESFCSPASSTVATPPRAKARPPSGSATPTLRHEILSKEISKLQDLMFRQEFSYQEQIAACSEEVEQLREKLAELEARDNQENLQGKLEATEQEANQLRKELADALEGKKQLKMIMAEYEKTISQVFTMRQDDKKKFEIEKEQIGNERDEAVQHLRNMEIAFNDVHHKYEKCKEAIEAFKHNEEQYRISLNENKKTILQQEENYQKLKEHAAQKLEQANIEITEMKKAHQSELAKMVAVQRKMEIRVKSLEESLEQKKREVAELTIICDDLITKVEP